MAPTSSRTRRPPRLMVTMMSAAARNRTANALMSKTLPGLDRLVHRITHGRATLFSAMMPTLMLVTTGRRSGLPRRSPLLYVEDGDGHLVVMASNFGQEHHSAWSANLLARPEASVIVEGRETAVRAELLTGSEREELFGDFLRLWAVYQDYAVRSGRELRMFRLTAQRG